jgi:hypothetical protein
MWFPLSWKVIGLDIVFGICASYTEVRQFLTSAANHEIAKTEVSCIPYGISPKPLGGDFIQEG